MRWTIALFCESVLNLRSYEGQQQEQDSGVDHLYTSLRGVKPSSHIEVRSGCRGCCLGTLRKRGQGTRTGRKSSQKSVRLRHDFCRCEADQTFLPKNLSTGIDQDSQLVKGNITH
jgi:hypothetical protein